MSLEDHTPCRRTGIAGLTEEKTHFLQGLRKCIFRRHGGGTIRISVSIAMMGRLLVVGTLAARWMELCAWS